MLFEGYSFCFMCTQFILGNKIENHIGGPQAPVHMFMEVNGKFDRVMHLLPATFNTTA